MPTAVSLCARSGCCGCALVWRRLTARPLRTRTSGIATATWRKRLALRGISSGPRQCNKLTIRASATHVTGKGTASLAMSAGANVEVVQRMLGHVDDDLFGVAEELGKPINTVAFSLRYSDPDPDKPGPISAAS